MKFKNLHEQYHNFRKNQYLFCSELEELIQREIYDFDARAYINLGLKCMFFKKIEILKYLKKLPH